MNEIPPRRSSKKLPDIPETYTPAEFAAIFHVDAKTVTRWEKSGKMEEHGIRVFRTFGGHRRMHKDDTDRVLKELYEPRKENNA
jgi:predicted site-specific integrase-resolvase